MHGTARWMGIAGVLLLGGCPDTTAEGTGDVAPAADTSADTGSVDAGADAGTDAGGADSGAPDAGAPDSSTPDSGTADSGTADSGTPDSSSPDSSSPDSSSPDSSTPDSSAPDSAVPDSGPADTGVPDAGPDTGSTILCTGGTDAEFPDFGESCATNADCTVVLHQVDCCGTLEALGIRLDEAGAFAAAEAVCVSQYGACGCASQPTTDDTGATGTTFFAACEAGTCVSHAADVPPTGSAALLPWLKAGGYAGWMAESAPHQSAGPHFGQVRVFVNPTLASSLGAGSAGHPPDAAAVKELYGNGATVLGWSVMVRTDGTAGGDGWYWFEDYQGTEYADGNGVGLCTGCHSGGQDFVLSSWPLQ